MKSRKSSRKKVRKAFKLFYSSKKKRTGRLTVVKTKKSLQEKKGRFTKGFRNR